jgi:hypothetical protein
MRAAAAYLLDIYLSSGWPFSMQVIRGQEEAVPLLGFG